jgi:hypothetical protein
LAQYFMFEPHNPPPPPPSGDHLGLRDIDDISRCMGKYATDVIIRATLVNLVQNYNLRLLDKTSWSRDKSCWITHPDFEIGCERIEP